MNNELSYPQNTQVIHPRHGQGSVMITDQNTTVVRFSHGIEQVLTDELQIVTSISEAVEEGIVTPSIEVVLRIQGDIITSINSAWGVFTRSRISLLPHQLWVCHRALKSWPIRLLIADDVGMGKTIEAGLILWPLLASRKVQRVLIVCPAKLVEQWQIRLKRMFDIRAAIYQSEQDNKKNDFWGIHSFVIASLPTLRLNRNGKHQRLLEAQEWDMVIVDEAHHLNADEQTGKTLGFELIEKLNKAGKIKSCILFTGTPHRGKNFGFWSLMGLLDSNKFSPKKNEADMYHELPQFLIRNSKQKATDMKGQLLFKPVVQHPETFRYSPSEESFYNLMSDFILAGKAYATSLRGAEGGQVMLVLIALQKLASSSIAAVKSALQTRMKRLNSASTKSETEFELNDVDISDEANQALLEWINNENQVRLSLMNNESIYLAKLIEAAESVKVETRITRIIEIIKERFTNEPVLLFTEYKRTQALMVSALIATFGQRSVGFINGDNQLPFVVLPDGRITKMSGNREQMCDAFNEGQTRFLVSTEAGGEGIDLQERCSALIHVDLPWNPMRLHQRVGRLNRYGQKKTVQVVSLRNPDTIEAMIWQKLEQKLNSIMLALGSAMDEPEDLMQLVLGMSGENVFDELFTQASGVPRDKLDTWFDNNSGTLGGTSAIKTVRELIGHAESFDLSDLKEVPPVDLPDLVPFFQNMLIFKHRRPKVENKIFSFNTPDDWLKNTFNVLKSYENLVFERSAPSNLDLLGIGHPLMEKALNQAMQLKGTLCLLDGIDEPMIILEVTSRLTDLIGPTKKAIVGIKGLPGNLCLLRDWEILRLLNSCMLKQVSSTKEMNFQKMSNWRKLVTAKIDELLGSFDFQFESPLIKESALFWPINIK
jgi:superfamily II DNA or RNA helicase